MTIHFVVENPNKQQNPYVKTLIEGLYANDRNCIISYGINIFEERDWSACDIVHIMWPDWIVFSHPMDSIKELSNRLDYLKSKGCKLVCTCHNLQSHYLDTPLLNQAYEETYKRCDGIIHLGNYSKRLLASQYPNIVHVVISHHVYDTLYQTFPSKEESTKHLKLDFNRKYVVCCGAVRDEKERMLLKKLSRSLEKEHISLLVPSFSIVNRRCGVYKFIRSYLKFLVLKLLYPHIINRGTYIEDEEIPYYYGCADVALIHRLETLNSGNVPLGLWMGKVIVGPNVGNVGEILQNSGNLVFDTNDVTSISKKVIDGFTLYKEGLGKKNHEYAQNTMSSLMIASQHLSYYKSIINLNR